jgi:hypothetical protein
MEKVTYPRFTTFHCFLAGGDMEDIISHQKEMADIGGKLGCKYLSIAGREGWLRKLKQHGWRHVSSAMLKPIGEQDDEWRRERRGANNGDQAPQRH